MEKRGRSKNGCGKPCQFHLRLTTEQNNMLNELSELTGESKTDLILEGLKMVNNLKKAQILD